MDKLEHDPRTKQQIKDALYAYLYEPVNRHFKTRIDTLVERNTILGGYSHKHFVYKGMTYNADVTNPPLKKNRLLAGLRAPMDEYLADLNKLNNLEVPYVLGFINQVLNASSALPDYMRVLPESVHQPLQRLMAECPCRTATLAPEKIEALKLKNTESINLMKQRLVKNLLI